LQSPLRHFFPAKREKARGSENDTIRSHERPGLHTSGPERRGWSTERACRGSWDAPENPGLSLHAGGQLTRSPDPSGGCLLTDGRPLRIQPQGKMVAGRDQRENQRLLNLIRHHDPCLKAAGHRGPVCLLPHGGERPLKDWQHPYAFVIGMHPGGIPWR
jgi:hypothetical protein